MSFCKILLTKNSLPQKDREFSAYSIFSKHLQYRRISHLMHYPQYRLERHNL